MHASRIVSITTLFSCNDLSWSICGTDLFFEPELNLFDSHWPQGDKKPLTRSYTYMEYMIRIASSSQRM